MNMNVLIEASAGTGKTQALAMRLIDLLRGGVRPEEIVALTFSRAAAGEIFERFVKLLADSALSVPADAKLLREVIEAQHLSQIGTLDSFLMRIVRSFPLELGIGGKLEMMDDYAANAERSRVSFGILRRTDAASKRVFAEAFALAMNHENVRSFIESYRAFVAAWHERYLAMPDAGAWGDLNRLGFDSSAFEVPGCAFGSVEALEASAEALEGLEPNAAWAEFVSWVRQFRGSFSGLKGLAKKFVEAGEDLFAGATVAVMFSRKEHVFAGAGAAAVRRALGAVYGYVIRQELEMARGIHALVRKFEEEYAEKVRLKGRLMFADVPRLILGLGEDARLALEYRMDAKIRAWALDEFQDTSREQWKALSGLLNEAKQSGGEKSVFVVGDRKQAIYGWRNGDVGIFEGEKSSGAYATRELKQSWRYGPALTKAINAVFVDGRLPTEFSAWKAPIHETMKPKLGGFVQTVEAAGPRAEDFVDPVCNALKAVDPVRRGISAAVLVRTNGFGEMLADALRRRGLKGVVWEGESNILDTPALGAFVDTLTLADHPGDRQAYEHFRRSPLAKARYGNDIPDAGALSDEFALAFATKGIVRTFRELRAVLPENPCEAWSGFTEGRFTDMLRAASEFELTMEAGVRLGDFVTFLASKKRRNVAEPGKVKIMTIHRSKGLGFDYVVLPLYEHGALTADPKGPLVANDWLLPDFEPKVTSVVAGLKDAWRACKDRVEQESLCTYYVAMTRAKQALTVVLHPRPSKPTASLRFSDFVRESIPEPIGDPQWYLAPRDEEPPAPENPADCLAHGPRGPRRAIGRRLPSLSFQTGESAANLFVAADARRQARDRGITAHAEYEKIDFLAPGEAKDDFGRALMKPEGFVALWRERAFEVLADGVWTSGRFDRVVFTEVQGRRQATVYDFKTNVRRTGESAADFASRMAATYAHQMAAYRKALAALTGIAPDGVKSVLLLAATRAAIPVMEGNPNSLADSFKLE